MEENEQIPMRLGGYANSHRPVSSGTRRDKMVLMGAILGAHLVIVAVLVAITRSTVESGPQEMVEVVEYTDIADIAPDGSLTAPTDEAAKSALEASVVPEPATATP